MDSNASELLDPTAAPPAGGPWLSDVEGYHDTRCACPDCCAFCAAVGTAPHTCGEMAPFVKGAPVWYRGKAGHVIAAVGTSKGRPVVKLRPTHQHSGGFWALACDVQVVTR